MTEDEERRRSPLRRQVNEAFCSPDGSLSPMKTIAIFAQISVLWHLNLHFLEIVTRWDSLVVVLTFLIAPNTVHKMAALKFGGTAK